MSSTVALPRACRVSDGIAGLPIRQIAYFVTDIRSAAAAHRATFGSGPFLIVDHIPTPVVRHRGRPAALDHSSAYGQWGELMIEFVQQHDDGPSAFHDLYPRGSGRFGLHHIALFVDDLTAAIDRFGQSGQECALYAETASLAFAMIDATDTLGHMIELYEPRPVLLDFYARIRAMADDGRQQAGESTWTSASRA